MKTTLLCPVYNNYLVFRANIESLLANIPSHAYHELLIVDDCSNEKQLINYLDALDSIPYIRVIKAGLPADCPHHNGRGRGILPKNKNRLSIGQGLAINFGIDHVNSDYVFIFDSDILFNKKSCDLIRQMEECMDLDPKIMTVGQLVGKIDGIKIVEKPFYAAVSNKNEGGFPNACAMLSRMDGWKRHRVSKLHNGGWCHFPYSVSIFRNGYKTCNFNVFKDGYLIHLGATVLRHERPGDYMGNFAFAEDQHRKYGTLNPNGSLKDWYAGHDCIPYSTKQFVKLLEETYSDLDFSTRKSLF